MGDRDACCVTVIPPARAVPSLGLRALACQLPLQILPLLPQEVVLSLELQRGASQYLQRGMLGVNLLLQPGEQTLQAALLTITPGCEEGTKRDREYVEVSCYTMSVFLIITLQNNINKSTFSINIAFGDAFFYYYFN